MGVYVRSGTPEEINRALRELEKKIDGLRYRYDSGRFKPNTLNLPTTPPTSPKVGDIWYDEANEEIKVYKP